MHQIVILICALLLIGVDQLTKYLAVIFLKGAESVPLIPGVFELAYVENKGAAFGILPGGRWFFIVLTAFVIGAMLFFLLKGKFRGYAWINAAAALIIAGGVGNLIDRILYGYVVDFFYFRLIDFPVFNFADCCVVVGAILLLIQFLFFYKPEEETAKVTEEEENTHGDQNTDTNAGAGGETDR